MDEMRKDLLVQMIKIVIIIAIIFAIFTLFQGDLLKNATNFFANVWSGGAG